MNKPAFLNISDLECSELYPSSKSRSARILSSPVRDWACTHFESVVIIQVGLKAGAQ